MGDSIIYKLKSGKPNKFLNFLSGFAGLAIPDAFFRQRLQGLLAQAPKHPDYDYIRTRGLLHQNEPTIPRLRHKQVHS